MNDPVNLYLTYLFVIDKNINSGTFGVFKMDFTLTSLKYAYTTFQMSSGSSFSVNSIVRTSSTDANDFLFAGKTQSLTDGTKSLTFTTGYGYVMKAKTNESTQNYFNFASGFSISLQSTCTLPFINGGFEIRGWDELGADLVSPTPSTISIT